MIKNKARKICSHSSSERKILLLGYLIINAVISENRNSLLSVVTTQIGNEHYDTFCLFVLFVCFY